MNFKIILFAHYTLAFLTLSIDYRLGTFKI